VEFTQREGQGVRHKVARTQEGRISPLLAAHRDESIARVIGELTGGGSLESGLLVEGADGVATRAAGARFLLPTATDATRAVLDLYERHLLAGSRQERSADGRTLRYLDKCENHFLLATAYAALAELLAPVVAPTGARGRACRRFARWVRRIRRRGCGQKGACWDEPEDLKAARAIYYATSPQIRPRFWARTRRY